MSPITNNLIENSDYKVLKESMPQKEHRYGHRYFTNQHGKHKVVSSESNVWQIPPPKKPSKGKNSSRFGTSDFPPKNPVKVKIVRVLGHFTLREIPVSRTISKGRSSTHLSVNKGINFPRGQKMREQERIYKCRQSLTT